MPMIAMQQQQQQMMQQQFMQQQMMQQQQMLSIMPQQQQQFMKGNMPSNQNLTHNYQIKQFNLTQNPHEEQKKE